MVMLIDSTCFPVGRDLDYSSAEELAGLGALETSARSFMARDYRATVVSELLLAFGIAPMLGLYLARFESPRKPEDAERWVVVGDLPSMHFETDDTPTPALALRLYCAIAQDWADNVIAGRDLSDSYPIEVAPTHEYADMLLSRVDFIRRKLIPLAEP